MNPQERELFWKTLYSLSGTDIKQDSEKLKNVIKYPKYLFRYRSVNSNNLEALRTNKLYFSSANYYDDPFDTFLHIDIKALEDEYLQASQNLRGAQNIVDEIKTFYSDILTPEQKDQLTAENVINTISQNPVEIFLRSALELRDEIKKDTWSICFSENGFNETLWLKYANQHKGFTLIYDLENNENFLCGKQEKCKNCGIKKLGTPLYPIYYSNDPYDATSFAKKLMFRKLEDNAKIPLPKQLYMKLGTGFWERERTTLIKKKCHEYDEEWRMIIGPQIEPPIMMEWIPDGIILGLRMNATEEKLVIAIAKQAGIKNIYKSYIDSLNQLNAALI